MPGRAPSWPDPPESGEFRPVRPRPGRLRPAVRTFRHTTYQLAGRTSSPGVARIAVVCYFERRLELEVMNEIVLNGILNLFSMQAARLGDRSHGTARTVLETFMRDHLGLALRDQYLQLFDEALDRKSVV